MKYTLRDKDPRILRDAYKMVVNIESNIKASSKLGRRDELKLFNPRGNKKGFEKFGSFRQIRKLKCDFKSWTYK